MRYFSRLVSALALICLGLHASSLAAAQPILTEYKRFYREINVKWDTTGPNVIELFSYNCHKCFLAESAISYFEANKPKSLRFASWALTTSDMRWQLSQYAFRGAYLAGVMGTVHADIFKRIFKEGKPFETKEDVRNYFREKGLLQKVDPYLDSQASRELRDRIYDLAIAVDVNQTPSFIVNGKYVVAWNSEQKPEKLMALLIALDEKTNPKQKIACKATKEACRVTPARGIGAP